MSITIQYQPIAQQLILNEAPNLEMMNQITERFAELNIPFVNPKNVEEKVVGKAALKIWKKYTENVLHNKGETLYRQKDIPDRMYSATTSCQGLPSIIRNTLYQFHGIDTDIECCHPTIACSVMEDMGLQNSAFKRYIAERSAILEWTMKEMRVDRSVAKRYYNQILYGSARPDLPECASVEFEQWMNAYYNQSRVLMEHVAREHPDWAREAKRKKKFSVEGSCLSKLLNNYENQIGLLSIDFMKRNGVAVYVYSFDGFIHEKIPEERLGELYKELMEYIQRKTGIPIRYVSKPMEKIIHFDKLIRLEPRPVEEKAAEEIDSLPDLDFSSDMSYNHNRVREFCHTFEHLCSNPKNLKLLQTKIYKYMDQFFCTIEDDKQFPVREVYHVVNGHRMRKTFIRMKDSWRAYCLDKEVYAKTIKDDMGRPVRLFAMEHYMFHFDRRKAPRFGYYPKLVPTSFYNTFGGFAFLESDDETELRKIQRFLDHVRLIWCRGDQACYEYTLNLFAWYLQRPELMTKVALVIRSDGEGAGKGLILSILGELMGMYDEETGAMGPFREIRDADTVFGRFNSMLEGAQVIWFDEALWAGDKKAYGKLLNMITEGHQTIEIKGYSPYVCESYQNLILAGNSDWIAPASASSRRFFVLDADNKYSGVQTAEIRAYFNEIANTDRQALANFLYRRDLSHFNPQIIPQTKALFDQKIMSMSSTNQWVMELLKDKEDWEEYAEGIQKEAVYERYTQWCERGRVYKTDSANTFWKGLKLMFGETSKRVRQHAERVWMCVFPSYDASLQSFCEMYKISRKDFLSEEQEQELVIEVVVEEEELVIDLE